MRPRPDAAIRPKAWIALCSTSLIQQRSFAVARRSFYFHHKRCFDQRLQAYPTLAFPLPACHLPAAPASISTSHRYITPGRASYKKERPGSAADASTTYISVQKYCGQPGDIMSSPLSAEEESRYTSIVDGILATADLTTVTRKKIRQGLETALGGKDLSAQKDAIKALIEERFDAISGSPDGNDQSASPPHKREANGYDDDEVDGDGEIQVSVSPVRKKQKREDSSEDADAKLAAELQAQENRMARGRTTRGGNGATNKSNTKKKRTAPKKKSATKVRDGDDSDIEGGEAPKRKAGGGFQKPFNLSSPLAELVGEQQVCPADRTWPLV
ncbi:swib mdm2 domain protein [Colletotrichum chrysophilum]|uniref:Swib mdm2 domain protein n=1 Tax=Colletotrichum chrysophilum TaxID=1836956 RepID=A0AAD9EKY8_9PEZI|nr:swib mdm2 domain protein [Colletotrichum chrysophilum]